MIKKITDECIIQIAKSALKKDVCPRFSLSQYMLIKDMAIIVFQQTGRPCNGRGDMCPALKSCSQARICLYASTRVRTHHFQQQQKLKKKREWERNAVIRRIWFLASINCVSNYLVSFCSFSIFINHVHAIKFKIFC